MTNETDKKARHFMRLKGNRVEMLGRSIALPASRLARIGLGIAFIIGGFLSFLPVLGIWMLPLGLLILSIDFVIVRRWRRRLTVRWERRRQRKRQAAAQARQTVPIEATRMRVPSE